MIRKMWLQFRERMVDPALADVGETFDAAGAAGGSGAEGSARVLRADRGLAGDVAGEEVTRLRAPLVVAGFVDAPRRRQRRAFEAMR